MDRRAVVWGTRCVVDSSDETRDGGCTTTTDERGGAAVAVDGRHVGCTIETEECCDDTTPAVAGRRAGCVTETEAFCGDGCVVCNEVSPCAGWSSAEEDASVAVGTRRGLCVVKANGWPRRTGEPED